MKENILIFSTKRLAVRRFRAEDAELLYRYSGEPDKKEIPTEVYDSLEATKRELDLVIANYRIMHFPFRYAIVLKEENRLIGDLSFKRLPDYNTQINIKIADEYQRKGYGTEVLKASAEYAKVRLGLDRVYALVKADNAAGRGMVEKADFLLEKEFEKDWFGVKAPVCRYII